MKHLGILFLLIATVFLLTSCSESNSDNNNDSSGYLKLVNNTNAHITVSFTADGSVYNIVPNSYMTFEFAMKSSITDPKGISTTYSCDGLYFHYTTFTNTINQGHTTSRILDADRGCIRFVNETAGSVDLTIPDLGDPITIDAGDEYTQAWILSGSSAVASFDFTGDFVFSDTDDMTVNVNATGTYAISATGAAIKVINNSSHSITQVYLSPSANSTWGSDDLMGTISPGNYVTWTVAPNFWDIKVVDSSGTYATWTENAYIDFDEMLVANYTPGKNPKNISRKTDGMGSVHEGQFKIQKNPIGKQMLQ